MGKDLKGKELGEGFCQIKDGRYVGRYTDKYGKRKSIYGHKLKEVKDKLNKAIYFADMTSSDYDGKNMTVDELYELWFNNKSRKVKLSTLGVYDNQYHRIADKELGCILLTKVDEQIAQKTFDDLSKEVSTVTLRAYKGTINNIFQYALKKKFILKNPIEHVVIKENQSDIARLQKKKDLKFLTQEQVSKLLDYAIKKKRKNVAIYKLILLTGLRCGEATALTWDDVDFENEIIRINKTFSTIKSRKVQNKTYTQSPKTRTSIRNVPMCEAVMDLLREHRKTKYSGEKYVFMNERNTPCMPASISMTFKNLVCSYNLHEKEIATIENRKPEILPEISIHALRHTFATRCFESDVPSKAVQEYMGHSTLGMTMLYTHVSSKKSHEYIKRINNTVHINEYL